MAATRSVRGSPAALTAIPAADAAGQRWTYYFPENDTYSRIDFLFASRPLNPDIDDTKAIICSDADWFTASDHRAVSVVIDPPGRRRRSKPDDAGR